jgi:uroporphyrinogen-III decarboxylase
MPTTRKQNMLRALKGEGTDCLPWAPRLDLWYLANRRAGTLPAKYRNATLAELVDDMGWTYHAIVPNFKDVRDPLDEADRALGLYNLWNMPYRTVLEDVRRMVIVDGDSTNVEYETPSGTVRTSVRYDESMRKAGITISHVAEHAIKGPADYAALGYIFENARVEPNYDGYSRYAESIGDRGVTAAFVSLAASPMHLIQRELMPFDSFCYALYDYRDEMAALADKIGGYWQRVLDVVCDCPADVVFIGANYDASTTFAPFFAEHITPWLQRYADALHARGKFLLTHTDGENTGLLEHYVDSRIDIADSICPAPMTKLTLKEVRDYFAGRIAILGGVPSVSLLSSSMSDAQFDLFIEKFFEDLGDARRHVLGLSDTTPPAAQWARLVKLGNIAGSIGPIPASSVHP